MNTPNPASEPVPSYQTNHDWQGQPSSMNPINPGKSYRRASAWMGGATLILLGCIFMLHNLGIFISGNWWALFFFIPASGLFSSAWTSCRTNGRLTANAIGSATGAVLLSGLGLSFLFNLDLGMVWPLFLIVAGLSILIKMAFPDNSNQGYN